MEEASALGEVGELAAHRRLGVLRLAAQIAPGGLHELDVGQPIPERDLQRPIDLLEGDGGDGAAEHGRVVSADDALHARHDTDAGDEPAADGELGAPTGEGAQLEKRRVTIEQELDALADEELAPLAMARHAALAATGAGEGELGLDLSHEREHILAVLAKALGARIDARPEDIHDRLAGRS